MAADWHHCCRLDVVTHGDAEPPLQAVRDPAALRRHEVRKGHHYRLGVGAAG